MQGNFVICEVWVVPDRGEDTWFQLGTCRLSGFPPSREHGDNHRVFEAVMPLQGRSNEGEIKDFDVATVYLFEF